MHDFRMNHRNTKNMWNSKVQVKHSLTRDSIASNCQVSFHQRTHNRTGHFNVGFVFILHFRCLYFSGILEIYFFLVPYSGSHHFVSMCTSSHCVIFNTSLLLFRFSLNKVIQCLQLVSKSKPEGHIVHNHWLLKSVQDFSLL